MDLNCKFIFLSPLPKIARQNISSAVFFVGAGLKNCFPRPAPTFSLAPLGAIFFWEKALLTNSWGCGTN